MVKPIVRILMLLMLAPACAAATAGDAQAPVSRGQALYVTHCVECHNTRVHWRDDKLAVDWVSLKAQVRRWQAAAGLWWSEADIVEVARHLNDSIYHYAQTSDLVGRLDSGR